MLKQYVPKHRYCGTIYHLYMTLKIGRYFQAYKIQITQQLKTKAYKHLL